MNIVFTVNSKYMCHVMDVIWSIVRFPSTDGYAIYILHSDIPEKEQQVYRRQGEKLGAELYFRWVDPEQFADFPENERYPRLIYYRIFAASFLPEHLHRALYLDGDVIAINSLEELYRMEFRDNLFLACTHVRRFLNKMNQYRLGMEEESTYINSGVMLMNLDELRKVQNREEVLAYVRKRKRYLKLPDQDIITALYGQKTGLIDTRKYNMSDRMMYFYNLDPSHQKVTVDWIRKNTSLIHYYGKQKPWDLSYQGKLGIFYQELKKEEKEFLEEQGS